MNLLYKSTRNSDKTVTASQAILKGLADDGGLFVPVSVPKLDVTMDELKEAAKLKLNCGKAHRELAWFPVWNTEKAFERTACWYREYYINGNINTDKDLQQYFSDAERKGLVWTK